MKMKKMNVLEFFKKNVFACIAGIAVLVQILMLILFYCLPDPLGLSLSELFYGKTIWQVFMALGAILTISAIFAFFKSPRALVLCFVFYFFLTVADYEVFRFSHQRLSYSFVRTYFHLSNITDATTISTLGGDFLGTILWLTLLFLIVISGIMFVVIYTLKKQKEKKCNVSVQINQSSAHKKISLHMFSIGIIFSLLPLIFFFSGTRGVFVVPVVKLPIDVRFTLGKYTLTSPVMHIIALETFEFIRDDFTITDELLDDLDSFLPSDFSKSRVDEKKYPTFRNAPLHEYKAKKAYNIVFIFAESYKGRIFNQMLNGDSALAPNLWKLALGEFNKKSLDSLGIDSVCVGGGLWFKNAFSAGYPTVRGTTSAYLGFPSHPNRDVPSFYASNHFLGFQELLTEYKKGYMTVSNPVFDQTLPLIEKFYGNNWRLIGDVKIPESDDSLGMDLAIDMLSSMPFEKPWLLVANTISTHIPFFGYPDSFGKKTDDAMQRYRTAVKYTDQQMGRLFEVLAARPDFERTVIFVVGDHDTPVDSVDYMIPQPLGVAASQIFMGIFSADTNLFKTLEVREDVASQLDLGPTILDLAQVRKPNHFWGYDLLTQKRPANQPSLFYSQNAYYLGFRDHVLVGGIDNEDVYRGVKGKFSVSTDSLDIVWKNRAIGTSKVLRSLLRNDNMLPH